jgi:hypothetical protein
MDLRHGSHQLVRHHRRLQQLQRSMTLSTTDDKGKRRAKTSRL